MAGWDLSTGASSAVGRGLNYWDLSARGGYAFGGGFGIYLCLCFLRYFTILSSVPTRELVSYQTMSIDRRMK